MLLRGCARCHPSIHNPIRASEARVPYMPPLALIPVLHRRLNPARPPLPPLPPAPPPLGSVPLRLLRDRSSTRRSSVASRLAGSGPASRLSEPRSTCREVGSAGSVPACGAGGAAGTQGGGARGRTEVSEAQARRQ